MFALPVVIQERRVCWKKRDSTSSCCVRETLHDRCYFRPFSTHRNYASLFLDAPSSFPLSYAHVPNDPRTASAMLLSPPSSYPRPIPLRHSAAAFSPVSVDYFHHHHHHYHSCRCRSSFRDSILLPVRCYCCPRSSDYFARRLRAYGALPALRRGAAIAHLCSVQTYRLPAAHTRGDMG